MSTGIDPLFLKSPLTIGTHSGQFHCDEALACHFLKILQPLTTIVRSRDAKILASCDIRVDVGGIYDPQMQSYDHHQNTFRHTMSTLSDSIRSDVRLSSAGLIYHHFGRQMITKLLDTDDEDKIDYVYQSVYYRFIEEVDGIDNGIPQFPSEPLYYIHTHLSARVNHLNRQWNSDDDRWNEDDEFLKAVDLVGQEFLQAVHYSSNISYPARVLVKNAILNRYSIHSSGEIIELSRYCLWKEYLFEIETKQDIKPSIKYVIFPDDCYRVAGVPIAPKSFIGRKFLPTAWRGLRGTELNKVSSIDGCQFVHATGFIGGNDTREGALQMAIKSLEITEDT